MYEQIALRLARARGDVEMDDTGRFLMMWILENIDTSQDVEVGMMLALATLVALVEQIMREIAEHSDNFLLIESGVLPLLIERALQEKPSRDWRKELESI